MMYPYGGGMGTGGWALMALGSVVLLGLLVAATVAVVRGLSPSQPAGPSSAEQMLADRFAHGDIEADEYDKRLHTLRWNRR
jgi:putative membrane protein